MPRKETKALVVIILIFDTALLAFWIVMFSFTKNQIADTISSGNEIRSEIIKSDTAFLMKNDIKYGNDYENNLDSYVVGKDNVSDLIKTVENAAVSSNLKESISQISYDSSDALSALGMEYVKISMSMTGSWKNIHFFIDTLEEYPLKIDIDDVSLDVIPASSGTKTPQWSGSLDFTVIKFK